MHIEPQYPDGCGKVKKVSGVVNRLPMPANLAARFRLAQTFADIEDASKGAEILRIRPRSLESIETEVTLGENLE